MNISDHRGTFVALIIAMILSCSLFLLMGLTMRDILSVSGWYMLVLGSLVSVFVEYLSWRCFFVDHTRTVFGSATSLMFIKLILFSILFAIALEALTSFGSIASSFSDISTWNKKRIVIFFGLSYVIFFLLLRFIPEDTICKLYKRVKQISVKKVFIFIGAAIGIGMGASVIGIVLANGEQESWPFASFAFLCIFCVYLIALCRKSAGQHPERVFLAISLTFGLAIAIIMPPQTGNSWDDQVHYANSVALSYVVDPVHTDADLTLDNPLILNEDSGIDRPGVSSKWTVGDIDRYAQQLDGVYYSAPYTIDEKLIPSSPVYLGYIPSAFGIWLVRSLGFPLSVMVVSGRVFNLLFYCFICFAAISITPIKKVLFSAVALFPTTVFLAANYSYDPWVVSLLMLAFALFFKEFVNHAGTIKTRRWVAMIVIALVAIAPKAAYFPLILLFLLMPRRKFKTKKAHSIYVAVICSALIISILSIVLPYFGLSRSNVGDSRASSEVNQWEQLSGILRDPFRYIWILLNYFINSYLPIGDRAFAFGYLEDGFLLNRGDILSLPLLLIIVFAIIDSDEKSNSISNRKTIIASWATYIITIVVIATALYLSFTPVGAETVNGCQKRYLFPLLAPIYSLGLNFHIINKMNRNNFVLVCGFFFALFMIIGTWNGIMVHFVD